MSVSSFQLYELLRIAFPGGSINRTVTQNRQRTFVVGNHAITAEERASFKNWSSGELDVRWYMHPSGGHAVNPLTEPQDRFTAETEDDLVGWVSFLREEIIGLAASTVAMWLNPNDLFPQGIDQTAQRYALQPLRTLMDSGLSRREAIERISARLSSQVVWQEQASNNSRFRALFYVNGAGQGTVVGRLDLKDEPGRHSLLQGRVKVPVSLIEVDVPFNETFSSHPADPTAYLKRALLTQYTKEMLDALIKHESLERHGVDLWA